MDNAAPLKVLFDNGILGNSDFTEAAIKNQEIKWGTHSEIVPVHGFKLITQLSDPEQQKEKDALFTVGQLLREGAFQAFTYQELWVERMRGRSPNPLFNSFSKCEIFRCTSPIERTKFRSTIDFRAYLAKGGGKDARAGKREEEASQIPFLDWLVSLDRTMIETIIDKWESIGLSDFEVQSLHEVKWFQLVAKRLQSRESLPDAFHLWAAKRNKMDVFLTLEKKIPKSVKQIQGEARKVLAFDFEVMRPREFLASKFGINSPDEIPMGIGEFYHMHEVFEILGSNFCD